MKKITKISLLAIGAAMVTQALQAQTIGNNDLVLGFSSQYSGVTQDYVIDLGQIPTGQTPQQLDGRTGDLTTFNSVFSAALAAGAVNVGIVGGQDTGTVDVFTSTLDNGSGTPVAPSGNKPSKSNIGNAALTVLTMGSAGLVAQTAATSFYGNIAENPSTVGAYAPSSYASYIQNNPLQTLGSGGQITLDLYKDTQTGSSTTSGWVYAGAVELDLSGTTLSAMYEPVPEPTTLSLLGGAGLLALTFRRKFSRNNA